MSKTAVQHETSPPASDNLHLTSLASLEGSKIDGCAGQTIAWTCLIVINKPSKHFQPCYLIVDSMYLFQWKVVLATFTRLLANSWVPQRMK